MADFQYEALDRDGNPVEGEISAADVPEAVRKLEASGLAVASIRLTSSSGTATGPELGEAVAMGREGQSESALDRHFDELLNRRDQLIPPLQAMVQELPFGRTRREISQLIAELSDARSGRELRASKHAIRWLPLLASGFSSDGSRQRFSDLIPNATRDLEIRNERRRILVYPFLVLVGTLLVLGLLTLLVVPVFDKMFEEFALQLPAPTATMIELSRQLRFHPLRTLLVALTTIGTVYGVLRLWTHFSLTTQLFGFALRGNSASVSAMSMLTAQLAELLQIGVPLADAIWIAGRGCEHHYYRKAAEQLARDAHSGSRFLQQSPAAGRFPANLIHALDVDRGGPSIPLLRELSAMYAERVHRRVDWTTGAMAQISIVVLGVAVAFMVIGLLAPLVSLISALS